MTRNAALVGEAMRLIERGTDWVCDSLGDDLFVRRSPGGFFARVGTVLQRGRWTPFLIELAIRC
jgi:hypothetical protein